MPSKIKSKWDNLDKGIQKWATRLGAIVTIIGAVSAGATWIIHQVDNAVAARLESQTEQIQEEVKALSDKVDNQDKQTELQLMRLELMTLIENDPYNIVEIEKVARHYFQSGGNSYLSAIYAKYCKQYGADCEVMFR